MFSFDDKESDGRLMDTSFLLAGGIAFLIAVLGWGDQIRGTQEKVFLQERDFLKTLQLKWRDVRALVRGSASPSERLASILRLLGHEDIQELVTIELVQHFESLDNTRTKLEVDYKTRFQLVLITSIVMLVSGSLSTILKGTIFGSPLSWEFVYATSSLAFIALIIFETVVISIYEESLRETLRKIDDKLRLAEDHLKKEQPN